MIDVKQEDDGSLTIYWDENDPKESILNTWTQEDFINAIQDKLNTLQELGEVDNATEAVNQVTEYFVDQTEEEVNEDIANIKKFLQIRETRKDKDPDNLPRLFF
jgi:chaperonin cofactor prefoldin